MLAFPTAARDVLTSRPVHFGEERRPTEADSADVDGVRETSFGGSSKTLRQRDGGDNSGDKVIGVKCLCDEDSAKAVDAIDETEAECDGGDPRPVSSSATAVWRNFGNCGDGGMFAVTPSEALNDPINDGARDKSASFDRNVMEEVTDEEPAEVCRITWPEAEVAQLGSCSSRIFRRSVNPGDPSSRRVATSSSESLGMTDSHRGVGVAPASPDETDEPSRGEVPITIRALLSSGVVMLGIGIGINTFPSLSVVPRPWCKAPLLEGNATRCLSMETSCRLDEPQQLRALS